MIKSLLSSAAVVALCSSAFAADLPARTPSKAPAPAFVAMNWSGFYAGVQAGVAKQRDNYSSTDADWDGSAWVSSAMEGVSNMSKSSFVGGVHAGFNHQIGTFVVGLEADVEGVSGKNSYSAFEAADSTYLYSETWSVTSQLKWQGSVRARAGVAVDRALIYVTGGVAAGQFSTVYSSVISSPASASHSFSDTRFGYTVGAGVQYALTDAWSVRAEYRYTDFGKLTHNAVPWIVGTTTTPQASSPYYTTEQHKLSSHAVRVGLSYSFGASQKTVVARY